MRDRKWYGCAAPADARRWVEAEPFDAVLLDLGLPDGSGIEVLRDLRAAGHTLPILVITARDSLEDRLNGLDRGADDYLVKPFAVTELLARLRAVLRRATGWSESGEQVWKVKDLVLDDKRMLLTRAGANVVLSKTEFALLHTLMRHPDRVLTRRELEARATAAQRGRGAGRAHLAPAPEDRRGLHPHGARRRLRGRQMTLKK
jgi:DNA-binding response OmpR family regulator